jgi:hypothetical protein
MGKEFEAEKIVLVIKEAFVKSGINIMDGELKDKEKELIDNLLPKYHTLE